MATSVHGINFNVATTAKNPVFTWFRFTVGATGAVGTIRQCKSQAVDTITRTGQGLYTVQFNRPYPLNVVQLDCTVARNAVTDAIRNVCYRAGTYNASTGQLNIVVSGDTAANNTAQIALDPIQNSELQFELVYQHTNALKD